MSTSLRGSYILHLIKYRKSKAMAIFNIHQHHNQTSSEQNTWATMILKGNGTSVLLDCETNANSHRFVQLQLKTTFLSKSCRFREQDLSKYMPTHDIQTSNQILSDYRPPKGLQKREAASKETSGNMLQCRDHTHFQPALKLVYLVYLQNLCHTSQSICLDLRKKTYYPTDNWWEHACMSI